jgi:hypothetical protein
VSIIQNRKQGAVGKVVNIPIDKGLISFRREFPKPETWNLKLET